MAAKVLVVDDEPGIRRVLTGYLEAAGFEVHQAGTGEDAVAQVRRHEPDVVLLDVMLPDVGRALTPDGGPTPSSGFKDLGSRP